VNRPSVRTESESDVVYSTNGTHGPKSKATVSSSRVFGRLPDLPRQGREGSQYEGLPEGETGDRQTALINRLDMASDEREMVREYSGRTIQERQCLYIVHFTMHPSLLCAADDARC
jgi:hypothetical protein